MIVNYYGSIVLGSLDLETSVAENEIIPSNTKVINFEILNDQNCHIKINNGDYIYVRANQGLRIPIMSSCKIYESSITFNWTGIKG